MLGRIHLNLSEENITHCPWSIKLDRYVLVGFMDHGPQRFCSYSCTNSISSYIRCTTLTMTFCYWDEVTLFAQPQHCLPIEKFK